ncbi:MAG: arginine--tRNA ligase, partial [Pseudohongiellaceae bacterium]
MDTFKHSLNQLVSAAISRVSGEVTDNAHVITASRPEFGDYQANGVMAIAKQLRTNPRALAEKVVAAIAEDESGLIAKLEVAGPGFINIHLADAALADRANRVLSDPASLVAPVSTPQTIVIDYSSPNLAKEMHVGHLRGTIIGDCLVRVLERMGHRVVRQNHVGDWGTQFGMLIAYMQELQAERGELPGELADLEIFYRGAKERFDEDPEFAKLARSSVVKLQSGEPEYVAAWELFIEESLRHCEAVYAKLGIRLTRDDLDAESRYNDSLGDIIADLKERGLLTESEGARCVFLPEFIGKDDEPLPVIVQKSDGGYLYSTTDLAAIKYRAEHFDAD